MDFVALGRRLFLNNRRRKRRIDCGFAPIDAHGATEIDDFFVLDEYREKSDIWFCVGLHTGDPIAGLSAADRLSQLGYLRSIHHRSRNPGADNLPVVGRRCSKRRRGRSRKLRTGQDAGTSGSQRGQKNSREALLRASIPALAMKSYYIFDECHSRQIPDFAHQRLNTSGEMWRPRPTSPPASPHKHPPARGSCADKARAAPWPRA